MIDRPRIDALIWDAWNIDHIKKHAVDPDEAEEAVFGNPVVRTGYKDRLLFIGAAANGRILTVVAGPVPGRIGAFYVFSARPASRRERADYHQEREQS